MKRSAKYGHRLTHNLRHRWSLFWLRVCRRAPTLCRFLESARKAIFRFDPEILEVQSAALCGCAAVRLGFRALRVEDDLSSAALLTSLLPFWAWSLLFALMGLSHVGGLVTGQVTWRATSAMVGVLVWSFVATMMTLDGLSGLGTALFPVMAISQAWVYLRLTTCCFSSEGLKHSLLSHSGAASESIPMDAEKVGGRRREMAETADV